MAERGPRPKYAAPLPHSVGRWLPAAGLLLSLLALWELWALAGWTPRWILPSPTDIVAAGVDSFALMLPHIGQTLLETLAGVLAERRGSVLAGLAVLAELGICRFDLLDVDGVALEVSVPESAGLPAISTAPSLPVLQNALAESAAYRRYFARSAPAALLPAGFTVRE